MPPPRCPLWPILANDRKRRAGLGWNPGPRSHSGQKGDEKKDERESLEWRELLKSARPLEFSPVVNYPKKEITVEFDHSPPLSPCRSVFNLSSPLLSLPPLLLSLKASSPSPLAAAPVGLVQVWWLAREIVALSFPG